MDRRERLDDHLESLRLLDEGKQAEIFVALPGALVDAGDNKAYDPATLTCTVQVSIQGKRKVLQPNGSVIWQDVTMTPLIFCPVKFPHGGGVSLTLPLLAGDEGLVVFAQRCIDAWWQSGGIQPQLELRMHDASDGFFVPGVWSQKTALGKATGTVKASAIAAEFRTDTGQTVVQIKPDRSNPPDPTKEQLNLTSPNMTLNSANPINVNAPGFIVNNGYIYATGLTGEVIAKYNTEFFVTLTGHLTPFAPPGPETPPEPKT